MLGYKNVCQTDHSFLKCGIICISEKKLNIIKRKKNLIIQYRYILYQGAGTTKNTSGVRYIQQMIGTCFIQTVL